MHKYLCNYIHAWVEKSNQHHIILCWALTYVEAINSSNYMVTVQA